MYQNYREIIEISQNTLKIEAKSLQLLKDIIDQDFCNIVERLYNCKGRIVVTGIGKSAIAAQKMVSTFNSTGTPALFMHAGDAIHGDLGMIKEEDIVMVISKSGNSQEIKNLLSYLKNNGICSIGLTNNKDSVLVEISDYHIFIPLEREAEPNQLAPTTSFITHIAIGDAIASSLIHLHKFGPKDFANFHPGGQLGKKLNLTVAQVYFKNEKPKVNLKDTVRKIILEISAKRLGATAVLNDDNTIAGIITDGDIRRMLSVNDQTKHLTAENIMSINPKRVNPKILAYDALEIMKNYNINCLIVSEDSQYLGMLHLHDLLNEGFS